MKTAAIIPAFNERGRLLPVVEGALRFVDHVIVVDDGSSDSSRAFYRHLPPTVIVLFHRTNLGKGAALKTGALKARLLGVDVIIFMDADGQHNPEDIPHFLERLDEDQADIVFGSRRMSRDMPSILRFGNHFLSLTISTLFHVYVSDTQSGFRAFRSTAYEVLEWESPRYAVEAEMIVNTGKHHLRYSEIEIQTIYHDKYKGTTVFDGLRIFLTMLLWRFT